MDQPKKGKLTVPSEINEKDKSRMGVSVIGHNLRKYVAYKIKLKKKQAQSMVLVLEKPALKPAM